MTDTYTHKQKVSAERQLTKLFVFGLILGVVGAMLAMAYWPSTTVTSAGAHHEGNQVTANFGLLLLGVGQILMFIPIIGWGVKLGLRAAP